MKFYSYKEKKNICGTQIREHRKKLGITQAELGARVQVYGVMLDQKAVSRIELLDRIVSDYELWALSQVLKLKMEDLLEP